MINPSRTINDPDDVVDDRVATAARSNLLLSPLIAAAGFAALVVLARILTPSEFVIYAVALAIKSSLQFFADLGTGAASSRLFAELDQRGARHQAKTLYLRLLAIRGLIGVLVVGAVLLVPELAAQALGLHPSERFVLLFAIPIGVLEMMAGLATYVLLGMYDQPTVNRVVLAQGILQPLLVSAAALGQLGLTGILAALLVVSVARSVALNLAVVRAIRRVGERGEPIDRIGVVFSRVAFGSVVGKLAAWVHSRQFVLLVLVVAFPRPEVAAFALAYDLSHQVLTLVVSPLYGLLAPSFARAQHDSARAQRLFTQTTRLLALILAPMVAATVVVFPTVVAIAFGAEYDAAAGYGMIISVAVSVEFVLSGPSTALMLSVDSLISRYAAVKAVTLLLAAGYFVLDHTSVLVIVVFMMVTRVLSAAALHAAIWRATHWRVEYWWMTRVVFVTLFAVGLGAAAELFVIPETEAATLAGVLAGLVCLVGVRIFRLLRVADLDAAVRAMPFAARALQLLVPAPS